VLLCVLGLPTVTAHAADHAIVASGRVFTPADVTITQGDTVTWSNADGTHNVRFEDGSFTMPAAPDSSPWSVSRAFSTVGVFRYYCELHGYPGGIDMSGAVYVQAATGGSGQPVSADRKAPALTLSGATRQRVLRQRAFRVSAQVDESSLVVARAWVAVPRKRKAVRAKSVSAQVAAGSVADLGLKLSKRSLRTFRRALAKHSRLTARVTVTARDPSGNTTSAKRRIVFKT
jgi:plastocyanin